MPSEQPEPADAVEPRAPPRLFALKHGDTFVVADASGDILGGGDGLFRDDTRVLSRFRLTLGLFLVCHRLPARCWEMSAMPPGWLERRDTKAAGAHAPS